MAARRFPNCVKSDSPTRNQVCSRIAVSPICENLPSLLHLDLRWSKVTDQGLTQLKELPFLRTLYLGDCAGITDEGAAILATMPGLESLNISQTKITPAGVLRVATLPRLRCLRATYYGPEVRDQLRQTLPVGCELVY